MKMQHLTDPPSQSPEQPWYALRVRSNFEQNVASVLRFKGYEEFLPTYRVRRRWSDRIKEIQVPLFAGYVFCRLDISNRLPVLTTSGVVGVVGCGKTPVPVTTEELEAVRAIVNSDLAASPWPFLRVGQRVELIHGPLTGLEGILTKLKGKYRLVVTVTLLQRSVAVEIDRDWARVTGNPRMAISPERAVRLAS